MARNSDDRSLFLRMLADHPYIFYASKKAGISRATIYRWMKGNPSFAKEVREIMREGLANQNEGVEMILVKKAMEGNIGAIKYYLPHNSVKYRPLKPDLPPPAISAEEREEYRKVYEWILKNRPIPSSTQQEILRAFRTFGYLDAEGNVTEQFKEKFAYLLKDREAVREVGTRCDGYKVNGLRKRS